MSESAIEITLADARKVMTPFLKSNYAVMLRGRHGIGKSEFVYQLGQEGELDLPVIERRASQMTDGDLLGLPDRTGIVDFLRQAVTALIDGNENYFGDGSLLSKEGTIKVLERLEGAEEITKESVTKFCPPAWFARACEEPVILFLDELDRASIDVRQGIFELSGSRKLFGKELHPGTRVVAAINGGVHSAQYQVAELGPAELDRWVVFDVKPDAKVWLDWAADSERVCPEVWDFINDNRSHLYHDGQFEDGKIYPTPRSWTRLSETLINMRDDGQELAEVSDNLIYMMGAATVGMEAASSFRRFWNEYEHEMSVKDFVEGEWEIDDLEDWGIPDYSSMINKLDAGGLFDNLLDEDELDVVTRFFAACPAEPTQVLSKHLSRADEVEEEDMRHMNWVRVAKRDDVVNGGKIGDSFEKLIKNEFSVGEEEEDEEDSE